MNSQSQEQDENANEHSEASGLLYTLFRQVRSCDAVHETTLPFAKPEYINR